MSRFRTKRPPEEEEEVFLFDLDLTKEEEQRSEGETRFLNDYRAGKRRGRVMALIVALLLISLVALSFALGRYSVDPITVLKIILHRYIPITPTWEEVEQTVVLSIRLPRILAALAVGGSLAVAGATYQGLFRNAMVSPDILGASSGASVGACLMMLFNQGEIMIQLGAFVMGLAAVALSYSLSKAIGRGNNMTLLLVLCGMTVNTLFQAVVSIIKYLADTDSQLPEITYWLMGSIAKAGYSDLLFFLFPFLIGIVPIMVIRWKLNVLSFGEDEARAMGINVSAIRLVSIVCSTLLTAAVVSIAGVVGWVGLMIPHLVRFMVGPNNKRLLPMSLFVGAVFMLAVDDICRTALAYEIPLGVLTSLLGAPFFILILFKRRGES